MFIYYISFSINKNKVSWITYHKIRSIKYCIKILKKFNFKLDEWDVCSCFVKNLIQNKITWYFNIKIIVVNLEEKKTRGFFTFSSRLQNALEDMKPRGRFFECEVPSVVAKMPRGFSSSRWKNQTRGKKISRKGMRGFPRVFSLEVFTLEGFAPRGVNFVLEEEV